MGAARRASFLFVLGFEKTVGEEGQGIGGRGGQEAGEGKMKAVPPRRHRIGVCTSFLGEA